MAVKVLLSGGDVWTGSTFERADVAIADGRIVRVGAAGVPDGAPDDIEDVNCSGLRLIPGLVNAHTHAHSVLARGVLDVGCLETLVNNVEATTAGRTPEETYFAAAANAIEMLRFGATAACDQFASTPNVTFEHLDAVARAYRDVGLRAVIAPLLGDLPLESMFPALARANGPAREGTRSFVSELDAVSAFADSVRGSSLIRAGIAPSIPVTSSDGLLEACADLAGRLSLPIFTHLTESKLEAAASMRRFGVTAAEHLRDVGLLGPTTVLAHAVWVTEDDRDLIAAAGAVVAHAPASNLRLGSGVAAIAAMIRRRISVAIGTDGATCSDDQNLFGSIRLAALLSRILSFGPEEWLSAPAAFNLCTVGGAAALGSVDVGTISPGNRADISFVEEFAFAAQPDEVMTQLVFGSGRLNVRSVMVDGSFVLRDGVVVNVDEAEVGLGASEAAKRLRRDNADLWTAAGLRGPVIHQACADASAKAAWPDGTRPLASASLALG